MKSSESSGHEEEVEEEARDGKGNAQVLHHTQASEEHLGQADGRGLDVAKILHGLAEQEIAPDYEGEEHVGQDDHLG